LTVPGFVDGRAAAALWRLLLIRDQRLPGRDHETFGDLDEPLGEGVHREAARLMSRLLGRISA